MSARGVLNVYCESYPVSFSATEPLTSGTGKNFLFIPILRALYSRASKKTAKADVQRQGLRPPLMKNTYGGQEVLLKQML